MPKLAATLLLIATAASPLLAADFAADDAVPKADQARELLAEGVKEFLTGRPEQAAVRFQDVLKLNPDDRLLYEFYLAVGDRRLQEMMELDQLDDVLKELLRHARIYQKELRQTDEYINLIIAKLEATEEERVVATQELVAIGPLAVPHLVQRINDNRQDLLRVYSRIALTKMGYRAVVPLTEALNAADQSLVQSVAAILADIGDPRALPKLKQLQDSADTPDTAKRVIANTIAAIQKKTGASAGAGQGSADSAAVPSADRLYFQEATRYFRGDASVQDEVIANHALMWRWDEAAEGAKKLSFQRVPRYAWNELMAEELAFDGLANDPTYTAFIPLLTAILAAQKSEVDQRQQLAAERTTPPSSPDESADAIAERLAVVADLADRVRMVGPAHAYRAIQQAIVSERYNVAVEIMQLLRDRDLAQADTNLPTKAEGLGTDKPGTVLVAALDHPDKMVRYQAAITLAALDPNISYFNSEKVVPLLAEAVSEWGMRVVVVVDQDFRMRNAARDALQRQGYLVYTAQSGFDLMERLQEAPIKDAIIIAGDLLPTLKDQYGGPIDVPEQRAETLVEKLASDPRSEGTPIFISLPENPSQAAKIQTAFDGKVAGFAAKPFNGVALKGEIETALADAKLPNANRENAEDVSLRAATALAAVDPSHTQYPIGMAADALIATLDARSDAIRIAALGALGTAARHPGTGPAVTGRINAVTDVYQAQDASLTPDVRAAFIRAIGRLDPTTDAAVTILRAALQSDDEGVRHAAHAAVGHAPSIDNVLLRDLQLQQRLDVRAAGAGQAQ